MNTGVERLKEVYYHYVEAQPKLPRERRAAASRLDGRVLTCPLSRLGSDTEALRGRGQRVQDGEDGRWDWGGVG